MKNLFYLTAIAVTLFTFTSLAAAQEVPNVVKQAFTQKFPGAQQVSWSKENTTEFEAEFTLNGTKISANFDQHGNWKETESPIAQSKLPYAVQQTLSRDYKKATVKHTFKVESPDQTVYEVEVVMGEEHEKMNEENEKKENEQEEYSEKGHVQELVFTKDGKLMKKEKEENKN